MKNPWDDRFAGDDFAYGTEPNEFLVEAVPFLPTCGDRPGRVVSLGEGEGRNAVFLASRGFAVTAIDGSAVGLAKAGRLAEQRGATVELVHADLRDATFPEGVDAFVSIFCHLPPDDRRAVHGRAWRALRPGGVFVIVAYRPEQIALGTGGPKDPKMLVSLGDVRDDLAGAEMLLGGEVERDVVEGRLHTGRAAITQVVFRKSRDLG